MVRVALICFVVAFGCGLILAPYAWAASVLVAGLSILLALQGGRSKSPRSVEWVGAAIIIAMDTGLILLEIPWPWQA